MSDSSDRTYLGAGLTPEAAARRARALLEEGASPRDVVEACYGVAFPPEFDVLAEVDWIEVDLGLDPANLVWELICPLEFGGPDVNEPIVHPPELRAFAHDAGFVPVLFLMDADFAHGDHLVGYHRDALLAGRWDAFELPEDHADGQRAKTAGDHITDVMRAWVEDERRQIEARLESPANRGTGSVTRRDLDEVDARLKVIAGIHAQVLAAEQAAGGR